MRIDQRGFQLLVAQIVTDHANVYTFLEQMRGIGMPQGVHVSIFLNAHFPEGLFEYGLHRAQRKVPGGFRLPDSAAARGRKQPPGMAMGFPVAAKQLQGWPRGFGAAHSGLLLPFLPVRGQPFAWNQSAIPAC